MALPKINHSPGSPCQTADSILGHYLTFLQTTQGLADATLVLRRLHVGPFLRSLETNGVLTDLRDLAPNTVHDYIITVSKPLTRASRKHLVSGLRSFLRFAHVNGLIGRPLVEAVPVILTRKLDRLPQTIPWEDVQKLLTMPDRATLTGKRDYAILRLVAAYGLRIGQAIHLRIRDIDWHQRVDSLSGREGWQGSLFSHLTGSCRSTTELSARSWRGARRRGGVLNRARRTAPLGCKQSSGIRPAVVLSSCRPSGDPAWRPSNPPRLRHAIDGARHTHQRLADLLGHRSIETTFLYTKVDLERLRTLAAEWPGVKP